MFVSDRHGYAMLGMEPTPSFSNRRGLNAPEDSIYQWCIFWFIFSTRFRKSSMGVFQDISDYYSFSVHRQGGGICSFEWNQPESRRDFTTPTPNYSLVTMKRARGDVVVCHAPHAGTFLEKGWIEEIFNRNRENNKEMNRDNKINRDGKR